jgi:hypothetical protein
VYCSLVCKTLGSKQFVELLHYLLGVGREASCTAAKNDMTLIILSLKLVFETLGASC